MDEKKLPDALKKETSRRDFLRGSAAAAGTAIAATAIGGIAPKKAEAQYMTADVPGTKPYAKKNLFAERNNCTGCRSCEYACSLFHTGTVRPALSRIYVAKYKDIVDVPVLCWQCDDAPCIKACPAKYVRGNPDTGQPLICDLCGGDPQCAKACFEQSGNPQGPCLMARPMGLGVNMAYRDVTPEQAGKDLAEYLFYPNVEGTRIVPAKSKTKKGR